MTPPRTPIAQASGVLWPVARIWFGEPLRMMRPARALTLATLAASTLAAWGAAQAPVAAQQATGPVAPATAQASPHGPGNAVDCYCTDRQGARVELGQTICLFVDGRSFTARCEMSQNNPTWRDTGEGCVSSRAPSLPERLARLRG